MPREAPMTVTGNNWKKYRGKNRQPTIAATNDNRGPCNHPPAQVLRFNFVLRTRANHQNAAIMSAA